MYELTVQVPESTAGFWLAIVGILISAVGVVYAHVAHTQGKSNKQAVADHTRRVDGLTRVVQHSQLKERVSTILGSLQTIVETSYLGDACTLDRSAARMELDSIAADAKNSGLPELADALGKARKAITGERIRPESAERAYRLVVNATISIPSIAKVLEGQLED